MQALAYEPAHSVEAGTNLSAMTVLFMFAVVTHFGVSRTEGTVTFAVVSLTEPFTSDDGGVCPART